MASGGSIGHTGQFGLQYQYDMPHPTPLSPDIKMDSGRSPDPQHQMVFGGIMGHRCIIIDCSYSRAMGSSLALGSRLASGDVQAPHIHQLFTSIDSAAPPFFTVCKILSFTFSPSLYHILRLSHLSITYLLNIVGTCVSLF